MAAVELSERTLSLLRLHFSGHSLRMGTSSPESMPGDTVEETRSLRRARGQGVDASD